MATRAMNSILLLLYISLGPLTLCREISDGLAAVSVESAEDCSSDQFYYLPQSRCRNCSDITYLFQSYQEWLGQEVSGFHKSTMLNGPNEGKDKNNMNKFPSNINNEDSSRYNDNDVVLSRLINVVPTQDQEYTDSSQDSGDSGSIESTTDLVSDISRSTKQTVRFVSQFIRSYFIGNELLGAIDQCRQYQNASACQMWSNMCVMTMYSHSDIPSTASSSTSSSSYLQHDSKANYEEDPSHSRRTWQKCRQYTITSICNSLRDWYRVDKKSGLEMTNVFAVDEPLVKAGSGLTFRLNQPIQLLAYRYSYNGKLIGVDQFGLNDMEKFCLVSNGLSNSYHLDDGHIRLGRNVHLNCKFDQLQASFSSIKHFNETIFIDLFIAYSQNGATFVKPVPILVKNLMYNGQQVNRKYSKDSSRWKLVHRFFLHTIFNLQDYEQSHENTLIYAKSATLDLKLKRNDKGALLNSILLSLDYEQLVLKYPIAENSTDSLKAIIESSISVTQNLLDMQSRKKDLDLIVTILSIMSSIWALIKCYNTQKCYGLVKLDLNFLFRLFLIGCDILANLLFIVTISYLGYIFMTLKFQTTVQVLAPNEELEKAVIFNLQLAFVLKLIGMAYKLYLQLNADLFFVDWEKPKMLTSSQILNFANNHSSNKEQINSLANQSGLKSPVPNQHSSFWRSYTVINRWLQLQSFYHHDITLQTFLFVCIVESLQLVNLATADVNLELVHSSNQRLNQGTQRLAPYTSVSLRLMILSFVYLSLSLLQIIYKRYLHEPIIRNKVREFVDLCSVANVSVLIMLYPRFGYYIHGRNANGSGDCSISEMNALLEREERDLCSKRGLAPNCDLQTFVLILPKLINDHYHKLLYSDNLISSSNGQTLKRSSSNLNSQDKSRTGGSLLRSVLNLSLSPAPTFSSNRPIIDTIVIKNRAINLFLTNFLEHVYKDIDYLIRDRRRFESLLLDVDFDDENLSARNGPLTTGIDKSTTATFCNDHNDSFTTLFLLSFENDLILVELLSLLILDLWLGQPLVMISCIVWLLHQTFIAIYVSYSRRNLVSKALVDEKFLLR